MAASELSKLLCSSSPLVVQVGRNYATSLMKQAPPNLWCKWGGAYAISLMKQAPPHLWWKVC